MATAVGGTSLTLLDAAKRRDPNGMPAKIAELLTKTNEILIDMPWVEGNLPTGHRTTVRTGYPTASWRKLNQGVPNTKSTTAQIDEACAMMQERSIHDQKLVDMQNNPAAFRLSESMPHIDSMNQKMADTLFYGSTITEPESFLGLAPRFDDVPTTSGGAQNKVNVIDAAGTGSDNTSIWLIGWGENSVHGIYPQNTQAGLKHTDRGIQRVLDGSNNAYEAYEDKWEWDCGLCVRDWRYLVRICNIDVSDLTYNAATGAALLRLMTRAKYRMQSLSGVKLAWYANRTVCSFLEQQITEKVASSSLTMSQIGDSQVMNYAKIPVRLCDALLDTEGRVT